MHPATACNGLPRPSAGLRLSTHNNVHSSRDTAHEIQHTHKISSWTAERGNHTRPNPGEGTHAQYTVNDYKASNMFYHTPAWEQRYAIRIAGRHPCWHMQSCAQHAAHDIGKQQTSASHCRLRRVQDMGHADNAAMPQNTHPIPFRCQPGRVCRSAISRPAQDVCLAEEAHAAALAALQTPR